MSNPFITYSLLDGDAATPVAVRPTLGGRRVQLEIGNCYGGGLFVGMSRDAALDMAAKLIQAATPGHTGRFTIREVQ